MRAEYNTSPAPDVKVGEGLMRKTAKGELESSHTILRKSEVG